MDIPSRKAVVDLNEVERTDEPIDSRVHGVVRKQEGGHADADANGQAHRDVETAVHMTKSEEFIRNAVEAANANALRMALYQITGDSELEAIPVSKEGVRGGAMQDYVLSPEATDTIRLKAVDYLLLRQQQQQLRQQNGSTHEEPYMNGVANKISTPSLEECSRLMTLFHGGEILSPDLVNLGREELGFEQFPREVVWKKKPTTETLSKWHMVIIGAGVNGISTAILLERLGIPYTVIDRQKDTGGTWMANTYPQARVDTLGFTFQYKFEHGYHWKEMFPSAPEIRKYLDHIAIKYGVKKNILFEREVVDAKWEENTQSWALELKLPNGARECMTRKANAIISACGLFSTPKNPDIVGISDFQGHIWHTTQWDHGVEWRGKKIAVIGNGSSGAQLIPGLAQEASKLGVYQRTPEWMAPYAGYRLPVPESLNWLIDEMPYYRNWQGYAGYMRSMQLAPLQVDDPKWRAQGGLVNAGNDKLRTSLTDYIRGKVGGDPKLSAQLVPKYAPLVRRLVVDNGYYDSLMRENTELITTPIDRITASGIRNTDGTERDYDMIVLACGFQPTNYLFPAEYCGRNAVTLDQTWAKDGARSYLGMVIPGYPNLFTMYGPNHQPRGGPSIHSWSEIWARYAVSSIAWLIENDATSMDVKQSVHDEYNARLDKANKKLLWEADGFGYFVNKHGRQAVNLPWTTEEYHAMIMKTNIDDFLITRQ